jgi:hypothetical protein
VVIGYILSRFGMLHQAKIWQPWTDPADLTDLTDTDFTFLMKHLLVGLGADFMNPFRPKLTDKTYLHIVNHNFANFESCGFVVQMNSRILSENFSTENE